MKLLTIFGTRPEIIRLSVIIKHLDRFCKQVLVHTGQNYDANLSDIFFRELELRQPDMYLGVQATSFAEQVGQIIARTGEVIENINPDRVMILGDTNSGLAAIVASRRGIPVFHLEAGNRCYDDRVPEEINRRIIDHCSTVLMPYTKRSKENLLREGISPERIYVTGNPIYEVLNTYARQIEAAKTLKRLALEPQHYFLVTTHREENVDDPERLGKILQGLERLAAIYQEPIVVSLHPRTRDKMRKHDIHVESEYIRLLAPLGFFDFVSLERHARAVLTDSGTVQEECCILRVPNVTIRDVTERPETVECGSNILSSVEPHMIVEAVDLVLNSLCEWKPPPEYMEERVSATVARIVLGYHCASRQR
jgi:UDP-N-acetylglucosamine 2-epimerase (non-hydrolysing)